MQKGLATLEIVFAVLIIGLLMSATIPAVQNVTDRAALDYETKNLYSDLRRLQATSRSGTFRNNGMGRKFSVDESLAMELSPAAASYKIVRGIEPVGQTHHMQNITNFTAPTERIVFDSNGKSNVNSGAVTLTSERGRTSKIVFDSVGRFRGGRADE
ncbi:MAG: type II secretion system protein [Quinella sp. 2Q5]|nr:type II secretion system protein [Quinella sp. 2Q5]